MSTRQKQAIIDIIGASAKEVERGLELHANSIVCDCFGFDPKITTPEIASSINQMVDAGIPADKIHQSLACRWNEEPVKNSEVGRQYLNIIKQTGVTCIMHNVGSGRDILSTVKQLSFFAAKCENISGDFFKAIKAEKVLEAKRENKNCLMWSLNSPPYLGKWENGESELEWLDVFHRLGVRMMHLTYNRRNAIGNGCAEINDGGLSNFGVEVIQRMNQLGIIIDVAHSGINTTLDAAKYSKRPIMASHTGCRSIFDNPRNKTDEEMKAIADTGGVIGIYLRPSFLGKSNTNLSHFLNHIDYAVALVGVDHVGIGTDQAYVSPDPDGFDLFGLPKATGRGWWGNWKAKDFNTDAKWAFEEAYNGSLSWINWPYFTVGLVSRGYSDNDIKKIIGGNFLRVIRDNE